LKESSDCNVYIITAIFYVNSTPRNKMFCPVYTSYLVKIKCGLKEGVLKSTNHCTAKECGELQCPT